MTLSGHGHELIDCAVFQEVKSWSSTDPRWLGELVGAMHDVSTKALGKFIDCHLQPASPSNGAEEVELNQIVDADQVVCDHTDQAERTGMINVVEEIDTD